MLCIDSLARFSAPEAIRIKCPTSRVGCDQRKTRNGSSTPVTTPRILPESLERYRATAFRRRSLEQQDLALRKEQAWLLAKHAAVILKEHFGATRVVLFGSLVHGNWFTLTSDIDIGVWGLTPDKYFMAVAKLQDLSLDCTIDLVAMEHCRAGLKEAIMAESEDL